jgi:hypothetical protein
VAGGCAEVAILEVDVAESFQRACFLDGPADAASEGERLRVVREGSPIELTGTAILAVRDDGMLLSNQVERNAFEVYKRLTAC